MAHVNVLPHIDLVAAWNFDVQGVAVSDEEARRKVGGVDVVIPVVLVHPYLWHRHPKLRLLVGRPAVTKTVRFCATQALLTLSQCTTEPSSRVLIFSDSPKSARTTPDGQYSESSSSDSWTPGQILNHTRKFAKPEAKRDSTLNLCRIEPNSNMRHPNPQQNTETRTRHCIPKISLLVEDIVSLQVSVDVPCLPEVHREGLLGPVISKAGDTPHHFGSLPC